MKYPAASMVRVLLVKLENIECSCAENKERRKNENIRQRVKSVFFENEDDNHENTGRC